MVRKDLGPRTRLLTMGKRKRITIPVPQTRAVIIIGIRQNEEGCAHGWGFNSAIKKRTVL